VEKKKEREECFNKNKKTIRTSEKEKMKVKE